MRVAERILTMDEVVRSKVVLIQRTGGGPEYNESFVGTVIVAEAQFCYIVTPKVMVRQEFSYDVFLPDRTVEKMTYDQFRIYDNGALAGFYVDKGVNNGITEFVIGDEATDFCEIGMCDFDKFGKLVLSYGRVILVAEDKEYYEVDYYSKKELPMEPRTHLENKVILDEYEKVREEKMKYLQAMAIAVRKIIK
ncbi:hypothetical protein PR202_gb02561 [Eleusine coracana subsp. coracana]|uniref:Uncharacterized protein n=1 Tax=Eleusine coracana subsp. coracana TaxID=191504 RepID=A0AAV5DX91_ELECO|nr:hypothetical protein PR202_gb02561 [Eleusine coracana subsp. coracana]